jgi:hypothetical protein
VFWLTPFIGPGFDANRDCAWLPRLVRSYVDQRRRAAIWIDSKNDRRSRSRRTSSRARIGFTLQLPNSNPRFSSFSFNKAQAESSQGSARLPVPGNEGSLAKKVTWAQLRKGTVHLWINTVMTAMDVVSGRGCNELGARVAPVALYPGLQISLRGSGNVGPVGASV